MRYHDGCFARHPHFHFVLFNSMMREHSSSASHYFTNRDSALSRMSLEELQEALESDQGSLLSKIVHQGSVIADTRPFWNMKRTYLGAYVRNINSAALFLTFSTANLHWHDLQTYMPCFED